MSATTLVVGLRRPRAGEPTVEVVLDSGERVRVHDRRVVEHGLRAGSALDDDAASALRAAASADAAERRALRLIGRRPRSRSELARRLGEWGLADADAAAVLDRLAGIGLVDDDALAGAVVSARRADGYGRLRVRHDLARLGIDGETTEAHAETTAEAEIDRARMALGSHRAPATGDAAGVRRAAAYLARRGFDADTVSAALGLDMDS
jgi:regulatory protein